MVPEELYAPPGVTSGGGGGGSGSGSGRVDLDSAREGGRERHGVTSGGLLDVSADSALHGSTDEDSIEPWEVSGETAADPFWDT